ncbi:MAG: branched-chain amino acid ABC transporter permease, partial [Chloroflexi bacterium]|nr:branched-chain amino acid ABC transporter permease [Chloroflexota bacterium]
VFIVMLLLKRVCLARINTRVFNYYGSDLRKGEARTIVALIDIVVVGAVLALGAACTWLLDRALALVLGGLVGALSPAVAEKAIFMIALLAGGGLAATVAYLIGMALLRLGSDYFGIATLGFAIMVYTALQSSDLVIPTMKGARGMVGIPRLTTWGWAFGALCVVLIVMRNLLHSSHGRAIISVREDDVAARMMGIDIANSKTVAFAFGGFFAGVAGGLYAHLFGFLHPSTFNVVKGFDPLIVIVLGGLGSMTGTVVASAAFALLIEGLRVQLPQGFEDWRFVIYPIFLLLIMLLRKQGLLGRTEWGWLRAPLPPARDIPVPEHSVAHLAAGEHEEG